MAGNGEVGATNDAGADSAAASGCPRVSFSYAGPQRADEVLRSATFTRSQRSGRRSLGEGRMAAMWIAAS
jgi:hypothetical protein